MALLQPFHTKSDVSNNHEPMLNIHVRKYTRKTTINITSLELQCCTMKYKFFLLPLVDAILIRSFSWEEWWSICILLVSCNKTAVFFNCLLLNDQISSILACSVSAWWVVSKIISSYSINRCTFCFFSIAACFLSGIVAGNCFTYECKTIRRSCYEEGSRDPETTLIASACSLSILVFSSK